MRIVADTNTFLAVALEQPERAWLMAATENCSLISPQLLPYEIGNALSALVKRKVVAGEQAPLVWDAVQKIPVELVPVDVRAALMLAVRFKIYAYDAYFLQCALDQRCPLLSLDKRVRLVAADLKIRLWE
jgi:predicted nucleic acid-binding protein